MQATLVTKQDQTPDSKSLMFSLDQELNFKAGQFIMILIPHEDKKVRRAYSISSSPSNNKEIELTIKAVEKGLVSNKLLNAKEGETFEILGPFGVFAFDESIKEDIVLIGAGSGISPLMSILRFILDKNLPNKVTLVYSSKTKQDIIFYEEFKEIKDKICCMHTLTRNEDKDWDGLQGRLNQDSLTDCIDSTKNKIFYLCGPPPFVNEVVKILKDKLKVSEEKIKTERF
jgi:glycine betaine catabolism B